MSGQPWIIWGSELSPFTLKIIRLHRQARIPFRFLPAEGNSFQVLRYALRRELVVRKWLPLTWPEVTEDDEFPLVPFLFGPQGENIYDSSAIAHWLDRSLPEAQRFTPEDPALRFLTQLIDEFADEWGLYLVHHQRWKVSAKDNDAGERVAREFSALLGPLRSRMATRFAKRQVRRLPYLFSVAPEDYELADLPRALQPPPRAGFPPTHDLLDDSFLRLLRILEELLSNSPFLFGDHCTLADISLYGELGMNLADPSSNALMQHTAPHLHAWLKRLHTNEEVPAGAAGLALEPEKIAPLLQEINRVFIPLMQQNHRAWQQLRENGCTHWNEAAFNRGEALYDGAIDGHPFRHVAKSFQAKVWFRLCDAWRELPEPARGQLRECGLTDQAFEAASC